MSKKIPGLVKRNDIWHIDKVINGRRICESTGSSDLKEAERFLAKIIEDIRQVSVYGVRPVRIFRMAATKYLQEADKRSLARDGYCLKNLDPYIGELDITHVLMGTLQIYIEARKIDAHFFSLCASKYHHRLPMVQYAIAIAPYGLRRTRSILNAFVGSHR